MILQNKLKPIYISLFAIISLILFAFATTVASMIMNKWFGILVGIGLMIVAIPIHLLGDRNKSFYIVSLILNVIGMGFIASAYYIQKGVSANIESFLLASVFPLSITLLCSIIISVSKNTTTEIVTWIIASILDLAIIITSIVFWSKRGGEYYSFSVFACIVVAFFLVSIIAIVDDNERETLKYVSTCSFGSLLGVFVVVLCLLGCDDCDCDCGGCDGCDCGSGKKTKKIK